MARGKNRKLSLDSDISDLDLVTRVAWMYYKEKMTQAEIAAKTFLSRQKVQRYLERARDLEIIQFDVKNPKANLLSIEEDLKKKFDLKDAVVVPASHTNIEGLRRSLCMAGAHYLERRLADSGDSTLGVGWGNTTAYLADYFQPDYSHNRIKVVSLIGNLMLNVSMNPFLLGQKIAEKLNAPFYNIWGPAIAQTKERANIFMSEPWISEVISIAEKADINLPSIGELSYSASLFQMGYLSEEDLKRLSDKGAVGDILCRFFDQDGSIITDEIHDRVVSISLDVLCDKNKICIGISGGASKQRAIAAAMRKKYINVLITDEDTAKELLNT